MTSIFTSTNQIRLFNVAIVQLEKCGESFEIACYKNKVVSWRNRTETDVERVLQTHTVFLNVSKGQAAKKEDLMKAFGHDDQTEICKEILNKGELQLSEEERSAQLDAIKDMATFLAKTCVDLDTKRPYPVTVIEKAIKDAHYSIKLNRYAYQQAREVIRSLKSVINIERVQMRVVVSLPCEAHSLSLEEMITKLSSYTDGRYFDKDGLELVCFINPGCFQEMEELIKCETNGKGYMYVSSLKKIYEDTSYDY